MQSVSPEKKIPAQTVGKKKKSCKLKIPPPPPPITFLMVRPLTDIKVQNSPISFPEPTCLLVSAKTRSSGINQFPDSKILGKVRFFLGGGGGGKGWGLEGEGHQWK